MELLSVYVLLSAPCPRITARSGARRTWLLRRHFADRLVRLQSNESGLRRGMEARQGFQATRTLDSLISWAGRRALDLT
jgi:hypothetical protein